MKNLILTLFTICMLNPFFAQIKTPQPSPTCTIQQTVGVTDVCREGTIDSINDDE